MDVLVTMHCEFQQSSPIYSRRYLRFRSSTECWISCYATETSTHSAYCTEAQRFHSAVLGCGDAPVVLQRQVHGSRNAWFDSGHMFCISWGGLWTNLQGYFFYEPLTPARRFQQCGRCASGFFGSPRRRRVLRRRGLGGWRESRLPGDPPPINLSQ